MANFTKSWQANVGLNHTPAYQVSGRPFATASTTGKSGNAVMVEFPYVTRWIYVQNIGSDTAKIAYSQAGLDGTNYFNLPGPGSTGRLEVKISELYMTGSANLSITAGLTTIPVSRVSSSTGPSFSGSTGVG